MAESNRAESNRMHERLDALVDEYGKDERSKKVVKQVEFYQNVAENGTKGVLLRSITIPGTGHFPLQHRLEGACFILLEILLSGTILVLFVKSLIAIFTSDPHYWRALLWGLGGAVVFRIVSFARVAFLCSRIKSDAAYLMLRLADKKAAPSK
jgi:hypothetical protein